MGLLDFLKSLFSNGKTNTKLISIGLSKLCKEVYEKFGDIIFDEKCKKTLEIYGNYRNEWQNKIQLLQDSDLINYTGESEFGLKMKILFNLF